MDYWNCTICRLKITLKDMNDPEWGCGECTMDDWEYVERKRKKTKVSDLEEDNIK